VRQGGGAAEPRTDLAEDAAEDAIVTEGAKAS
jgi:hypothetical protein